MSNNTILLLDTLRCQIKENEVLNEPVRFEEIVVLIINFVIIVCLTPYMYHR